MRILSLLLASIFILSGCVSTKTHRAALDESEVRRLKVENLTKRLEEEKAEKERLMKGLEELGASRGKEVSSLEGDLDELRREKEALEATGAEKSVEISSLMGKLAESEKEKDYLERELDRLKLKSGELTSEKEKELAKVKTTYESLVKELEGEIERGEIRITQAIDRLSVNLVEKILFDSGKADIKPEGKKVLKRVGVILKDITDKQIRVEGHTDNVPIGARIMHKFPTNWELSTARATNVVRYLQEDVGLSPEQLSAAGYSLYRPVAGNETAEGKAQNKRIEIVLLPLDVDRVLEELKK